MQKRSVLGVGSVLLIAAAACGGESRPAQDPTVTSGNSSTATGDVRTTDPATTAPVDATHSMRSDTTTPATAEIGSANGARATTGVNPNTSAQRPNGANPSPAPPSIAPAVTTPAPVVGATETHRNPDNTKVNERDRHSTLTPIDQGNSAPELKITATIRKSIVGDKALSFNAKNVKVITTGTKVTLRGPVKSDAERSTIESIARQTAGVSEVDNQLEVKK